MIKIKNGRLDFDYYLAEIKLVDTTERAFDLEWDIEARRAELFETLENRNIQDWEITATRSELKKVELLLRMLATAIKTLGDKTGKLNHNFRMAAKHVLPEDQYNTIMAIAKEPRKKST